MFMHNKRLQYTVRVAEPNPALASLLLEATMEEAELYLSLRCRAARAERRPDRIQPNGGGD